MKEYNLLVELENETCDGCPCLRKEQFKSRWCQAAYYNGRPSPSNNAWECSGKRPYWCPLVEVAE